MIDAHVQFNGVQFQGYREKQPNFPCEFEDHRTCKDLSARLQAQEDEKTAEVKAQEDADRKAAVDAAAAQAIKGAEQAKINAAAKAKGEAIRLVNLGWQQAVQKITEDQAAKVAGIRKDAQDAEAAVNAAADEAVADADAKRAEALAKIEATDWLKATAPQEAAQ